MEVVIWKLYLLLSCIFYCQATFLGFIDEPMVRHDTHLNPPDKVIEAGETIQLTCAAAKAEVIAWKYPQKDNQRNNTDIEVSLHTTNNEGEWITPYYTSTLLIFNASHIDTGSYECYCGGMGDIEHVYGTHIGKKLVSKRSIYVYVADETQLFQGNASSSRVPLSAVVRGNLVLPCAVTHPNTSVQLLQKQGYNKMTIVTMTGKKYTYDPSIGFIISQVSLRDSGAYTCLAESGNYAETREFYLHVMRGNPLLQKPVLRGDESVALGKTTTLKCHVAAGKHQLTSVTWWKKVGDNSVPIENGPKTSVEDPVISSSMCSNHRLMCSFMKKLTSLGTFTNNSFYIRLTGRLRIVDADTNAGGSYFCKAWSGGLSLDSNIIDLKVTPSIITPPEVYH